MSATMTRAERDHLRALIDRAKREKVGHVCELCGAPFELTRPNKRFCSEKHRKAFSERHTVAGRVGRINRKRRWRARVKALSATKGS